MAKVLVVGGAGYVGSQTAKILAEAGHEVIVYDNLSTGFRELVRYGKLIVGDILDRPAVRACLEEVRPDAVMHFAALALVGESVSDPALYYQTNVTGSWELFEAARALPKRPVFIFSSTCSVHGETDLPLTEENAIAPMNPYAQTKYDVERMLADFDAAYGFPHVCLRYFNAAGCDPGGEVGELHEPESHLIPRLLLHVLKPDRYPVQIFGEDYPTPDGTCIRDYVHVEDLARAHLAAMQYLLKGGKSALLNLGSAQGNSVREVVQLVEKVTGTKLNLKVAPRRAGDPPRLVAGSRRAHEVLGWTPRHNIESIVSTAWAWAKEKRR